MKNTLYYNIFYNLFSGHHIARRMVSLCYPRCATLRISYKHSFDYIYTPLLLHCAMYEIEVTTPPMEALDNDALAIIFSFLDDVSKFRLRATCSRMRLLGDELCTVLSVSLPDSIRFDLYMMKHLPFLSRLRNLRGFRIPETPYLVPE